MVKAVRDASGEPAAQKKLDSVREARSPFRKRMGRGNGRVTSGPRTQITGGVLRDSYCAPIFVFGAESLAMMASS